MQINPLLLIVMALLLFGGGYVFHMLDSRVTTALKQGREPAPGAVDEKPAQKIDNHGVLRVTLDPTLKWHLELDGVPLEPDGVTAEQRTRLVNVIVQIRPWIDGKTLAAPAPAASVPTRAESLNQPAGLTASVPMSTRPVVPAVPAPALRLDIGRGFRTMLEQDLGGKKTELLPPTSIVSMIDEVLQQKLANSPLAVRGIRLEDGPAGEVIVFVGLERYAGVDAVPDENIKALIREAIADWDKKTG